MQLCGAICYVLLTITVTAVCVRGENKNRGVLERRIDKRVNKREATILIDDFHIAPTYSHKPKVIYRRVSRYGPPKSKYGPPRPKYSLPKVRKPSKKYKKHINTKYGASSYKPRSPKPRYTSKRPSSKPIYGVPKKVQHYNPYPPQTTGFGEPPSGYVNDYPPHKQTYAEPPVDSYGAPLKAINDQYPTSQIYPESPTLINNFESQDHNFGPDYLSWQSYQRDQSIDNQYAYSKKRPTYVRPEIDRPNINEDEEPELNSYSDVYGYNKDVKDPYTIYGRKKKPQYFANGKGIKSAWTAPKLREEPDDEILVGGQYAEPPARYVPKFQPSAPMYNNDEDFVPPQSYVDSEVAASATISPYVNYKNSNMAFSPQNLNDAFSIVEK